MAKLLCAGSGSSGNSYAIRADDGEILLIECGVNWKKILKMIDFNVMNVVSCLVSHVHGDHVSEFKNLMKNGIPIYTNDETAGHFEVASGKKMIGVPEKIPFKCGSFVVTPFYLPHTTKDSNTGSIISCPNFGYMIQNEELGALLYMTDLEYCPYSFKSMKVQHLMIECNYIDDMVDRDQSNYIHRLQGHCSLETCKGIIKSNMTPSLITVTLIHLSDTASDEEQILRQVKEIVGDRVKVNIAKPGLEVELNRFPF